MYELLARTIPVIREGGDIPLRSIAEAIAGEKIGSNVRAALDARGRIAFSPAKAGKATFTNVGEARELGLKSIKLKIPKRLSGWAQVLDEDQGVVLRFDKHHTLSACKMLVCADVEAVELTKKRIFVDMEGKAFDRTFDLGADEGERDATASRRREKPASEGKEVAGKAEKPARTAEKTAREPRTAQQARQPRRVVEASAQKNERSTARAQGALRSAVEDAKSNIRAGVGQTLKSAAESQWAAKQAVHKAARDAKSNIQPGLRQTRKSAAESRKEAKAAARKASASARGQLEQAADQVRSKGKAVRPQGAGSRGYLGVTTYPVRLPAKLAAESGTTGGLIVLGVQPDGPADEAGLQLGDTLLELGGKPTRKPADLRRQLSRDRVGQKLEAIVLRAGKTSHLTVEVGAR